MRLRDRSKQTCLRLWEAIPLASRKGHCKTRLLGSLSGSAPMPEQHTAVGKETGETAHVERWNNILRQRLARFVRMTLSFSKSVVMLRPHVYSSFFTATIESEPSCSSGPLPIPTLTLFLMLLGVHQESRRSFRRRQQGLHFS
jgi:IS1 family transposase